MDKNMNKTLIYLHCNGEVDLANTHVVPVKQNVLRCKETHR